MKIIFDYNRTLVNPETDTLYRDVLEVLKDLSMDHELFLVSRNEPGRMERLGNFDIKKYFKKMLFVKEKTTDSFRELVGEDRDVVVVGDRVREEIRIGNQLGFTTIWVQQGKFADELPLRKEEQPTHIVKELREIKSILSTYEK